MRFRLGIARFQLRNRYLPAKPGDQNGPTRNHTREPEWLLRIEDQRQRQRNPASRAQEINFAATRLDSIVPRRARFRKQKGLAQAR